MKFYIKKLILWLRNGENREYDFLPNKVNVITGESGTGKSEILSIIDYCFFYSRADITEEKINENVNWYGIQFVINDKTYTIARGKIVKRKVSSEYYFSPQGDIPNIPKSNFGEKELKLIIEKEFGITERTVFPYGGKKISLGSKISFRYFFMFNTQSGDTIDHSEVFFDKQNNDKYREALERIFDLGIGIETEENLIVKEELISITKEINQLKKKQAIYSKEFNVFKEDILSLANDAKRYNLIPYDETDFDDIYSDLKEIVANYRTENITLNLEKIDGLTQKKNKLIRKIRNLKRYKREYEEFIKIEKRTLDSLKPAVFFKEKYYEVLNLPDLNLLITNLEEEFRSISKNIKGVPPFDFDIDKKIKSLEEELQDCIEEIERVPTNDNSTENEIDKLMFIGEVRAKLRLFNKQWDTGENEVDEKLKSKEARKSELEQKVVNYQEQRESVLRLLEELIQAYLDQSEDALDIYKGYKASFNYKEKKLELRRPKSSVPSKVGSSSNHLFLHLCLFLGLHELIIRQDSRYIPQWLVLDQPSRPYFGEEKKSNNNQKIWTDVKKTDRNKITIAMTLLNDFIEYINKDLEKDFQMIVFEHIPTSIWTDANLKQFHLVAEFRDGKALI
ncbi:hypothetical protein BACERE00193_04082 [Bacillus paranthracis]|uniref:DUF3732 domain-containing protein n=1 Tax=Bacillus cereus group TaxID=86661 RepID=UPI000A3037BE|nr:DUF3732 domain-containing protein [Bacillus paranthracis]MCR6791557.1 DUF3732 domain-containing protein [Bacillus paranthracis]SME26497.1 hypothetical protein BACERE00193_04082 [Bacillus paranthracis]